MEEKDIRLETDEDAGTKKCKPSVPEDCYYRRKQVERLVQDVKDLDSKYDKRTKELEHDLGERLTKLEAKSDERDRTIEDKLSDLDKDFTAIFAKNNVIMEKMTERIEESTSSYKIVGEKMQEVVGKVESIQKDVTRIDTKVSSLEHNMTDGLHNVTMEIHDVEKEVHEVDNKSKVDVVTTLRDETKSKIGGYLLAGGAGAGIIGLLIALLQHFAQ